MATRYCIHGATYNGDGSSSAEAASAGAAGAYNDLVECFKNTASYTVDPGDTCFIKSSPAGSGGGDVTVSISVDVTVQAGTGPSKSGVRHFIVDDGTVWAQSGVLKFEHGDGDELTFNAYTILDGINYNIESYTTYTGYALRNLFVLKGFVVIRSVKFSLGVYATAGHANTAIKANDSTCVLNDIWVYHEKTPRSGYGRVFINAELGVLTINNLKLEYATGVTPYSDVEVLRINDSDIYRASLFVNGLTLVNHLETSYLVDHTLGNFIEIVNAKVDYINNVTVKPSTSPSTYRDQATAVVTLADSGGFVESSGDGSSQYVSGEFYPVGNAVLPNGDGWSIKCFTNTFSYALPKNFFKTRKFWNATASQVKVTVELLVRTNFTNVDAAHFWIDVQYIDDSTGDLVSESTCERAASSPSSLATGSGLTVWDKLSYGANAYSSKKIELTTNNDVKEDTEIYVILVMANQAPDSSSFCFADPDPLFTAV